MKLLLKNVNIIGYFKEPGISDILCEDGLIAGISRGISADGCAVIDCGGLSCCAGLVDMHTHLRDPGFLHKEDIRSGGSAAAAGGVCHIACMPNTSPVCDNAETVRYIVEKSRREAPVRVYPIAAVTVREKGERLTDFNVLKSAGAVAFSDDGMPVMNDRLMEEAMVLADRLGVKVISHCEDFNFVPGRTAADYGLEGCEVPVQSDEEGMAARDAALAKRSGAAVHIAHVSTENTVAIIRWAKSRGVRVTCETAPHYMLFTKDTAAEKGTNAKMNPPLREEKDRLAVIEGVKDGTIDAIITDHAPHSAGEKSVGYGKAPNGIIGLETLFAASVKALRNEMGMEEIIYKLTAAPAGILGIDAGALKVGGAADITVFDPAEKWVYEAEKSFSKSRNTPFDGYEFDCRVKYTVLGGKVVYSRSDGVILPNQ